MIEDLITLNVTDNISVIQNILNSENREKYGKVIPTSLCHSISTGKLQILEMRVMVPSNALEGIVSNVKSKLIDIILELEKKYKDLDTLDIKSQVDEDISKKEQVIFNIEQIIYDGSIEIGDKNSFSNSKLGHQLGGTLIEHKNRK